MRTRMIGLKRCVFSVRDIIKADARDQKERPLGFFRKNIVKNRQYYDGYDELRRRKYHLLISPRPRSS